jgi:hypothetical protein
MGRSKAGTLLACPLRHLTSIRTVGQDSYLSRRNTACFSPKSGGVAPSGFLRPFRQPDQRSCLASQEKGKDVAERATLFLIGGRPVASQTPAKSSIKCGSGLRSECSLPTHVLRELPHGGRISGRTTFNPSFEPHSDCPGFRFSVRNLLRCWRTLMKLRTELNQCLTLKWSQSDGRQC